MKKVKKALFYVLAIVFALQFLVPLIWMILSSFKIDEVIYKDVGTIFSIVPNFSDLTL
ncbi:hypothetical protein [uncultured Metabacillus sp.]|uniref:hypothetical protein n=1 Tax=uncultured Metabacillus sp. TaxID=2860135 RepID=UPI00262F7C12|nr:hypothetical protein [uncultured Metabacillus sp.]